MTKMKKAGAKAKAGAVVTHSDLFAAMESSVLSCRPLVDLFYRSRRASSSSVAADDDDDDDDEEEEHEHEGPATTTSGRREAILDIVRDPGFNRSRSRRLFGGMLTALTRVVEGEDYLPPDDDDYDDDDDDYRTTAMATAEETARFLGCCARLVEAHLEGLMGGGRAAHAACGGDDEDDERRKRRSHRRKGEAVDEALDVACALHDLLFPLQRGRQQSSSTAAAALTTTTTRRWSRLASSAQSDIFSMCEAWWHGDFVERERLVTQLVPLLLVRSLDVDARRDDVRRLCSVRRAIDLLDFDDESIASLRTHLLRTVGDPLFLRCPEGRRFVGHLLLVDGAFVADVHGAIRAQIPGARRGVLDAYADIYYGAWRASTEMTIIEEDCDGRDAEEEGTTMMGEIQSSIEENALQDLMYHAMHASSSSTAKSARAVLDRFHVNKKSVDVESMLHRTYGPLLWRGLSSANAKVRARACAVLADTFPLRDPRAGEDGTEAVVSRSVAALVKAMGDEVPLVRAAGSAATARILGCFWAMIPTRDIRTLLNQIVAVHASDASSPAVRAAAVDAVTILLEEDRTHAVFRPLLPSIGNLIHDRSDRVRLAVVNMLLLVKKIRGMKYYHVVPANHLLARLADEGRGRNDPRGPVARALSDLLSNSFFPTGSKTTMTDIVNRTLRLLSDSPQAAVVFYRNASSHLSVNSISKLIAALTKCLCFFVIEEKRKNREDVRGLILAIPEVESIQCKGGHSSTAMMATIAEGVFILWESIEEKLGDSENERAHETLADVFSGNILTEVYRHFVSKFDDVEMGDDEVADCSRALVAILNCAGKLEGGQCEQLRAHIVDELRKSHDLPTRQRMVADLSPNIALLCRWGMMEDVVQCLASSIRHYFEGDADEPNDSFTMRISGDSRRRTRRSKNSDAENLPTLDIDVCLGIVGNVLKGSHPASASLRTSIMESETTFEAISSALETAKSAAERIMKARIALDGDLRLSRHLGIAIECYGRLLIHKSSMNGDVHSLQLTPDLRSLMIWVTGTVVPSLVKLVDQDNTLSNLDVSGIMSVGSPISAPISAGLLGDSSFIDERRSINVLEDKSKSISTRVAVICCASSVILNFAEWLSIRFVGDPFVTGQMSEMCKLLESSDMTVRMALSPLLFHTAIICLNIDGDAALFEKVLLSMKNVEPSQMEADIIHHSMSAVLAQRDERILKVAMCMIIRVTRAIVFETEENDDSSMTEPPFIEKVGAFMWKVIEHVLSEKRSSLLLAQCLIDEPKAGAVRESIFKALDERSPKTNALNKILRRWASENSLKDTIHSQHDDKENSNDN